MNKSQLIDAVADSANIPKAVAGRAVESAIESIMKTLAAGNQVTIAGLGTLGVKKRNARMGRDPRTGGQLHIPEAMVAFFKPAKALKEAINGEPVQAA